MKKKLDKKNSEQRETAAGQRRSAEQMQTNAANMVKTNSKRRGNFRVSARPAAANDQA